MSLLDRLAFRHCQLVRVCSNVLLPVVVVVLATETNWLVTPFLSLLPPFLTFLAAVMVTAWFAGFPSAAFATALSAMALNFYFIPPLHTFVLKPGDLGVLGFFGVEAITMAYCIVYLQNSRRDAIDRKRQLQRLHELGGRLVEETTLDSMLEEVVKASIELLGAEKGVIQLYEARDHVLRLIKQIGFPEEFTNRFQRVPIGSYSCGTAFERKHRVIIENVAEDREFAQLTPLFREFGVVGAQSTPLFNPQGKVFGVLSSYWPRPYRPSASDLQLLDLYAHQAERILLYKRNEEVLCHANEELERRVTRKQMLLMEREAKLANLMSELLLTEERERRELSGELHDSLAQLLSFAKMKLHLAGQSLMTDATGADRHIQETEQVLDRSLQYTRTLMAELDPPCFEASGLPAALVWLRDRMRQYDLQVTLQMEGESSTLPRDHVVLLYKCIRELLMNVVKHANVKSATVTMRRKTDQWLEIIVRDEGTGFRVSTARREIPGHHFGLRNVRERVEDLGGRFDIQSKVGRGCTAILSFPIRTALEYQESRAAQKNREDRVVEMPRTDPNQETLPLF